MIIERCTRSDFDEILRNQVEFWSSDRAASVHHPIFITEFGETAFVVRSDGCIVAYLFGFFVPGGECFYIHLVAVRSDKRRGGFAALLYDHVEALCLANGAVWIKAITPPTNATSLKFHAKRGFEITGSETINGVRFFPNYSGEGRHMSVLLKSLADL